MHNLTIIEDTHQNYQYRTRLNAGNSDVTIAFAADFKSAGELLTKKCVIEHSKTYFPITISTGFDNNLSDIGVAFNCDKLATIINGVIRKPAIVINIAGNGISTLQNISKSFTQEYIDNYVYIILNQLVNHSDLFMPIAQIRSGGQSGVDEAGIKAGLKLGIPTLAVLPKNYRYRKADGTDTTATYDETFLRLTPNGESVE